jgi:N-acetylglucosaminyldiphosphoundecaprenol N-acetyl-beta-D-mannosaminyltransferase
MRPTKTSVPQRANVLGIGISAIDMQEAVLRAEQLIRARGRGYICVTGVHGIMEAQRDPALRDILNRAYLCTPDGMPTVWVGRLQGHGSMRRVYGPDFMLEICRRTAQDGLRHFLYGGGPGVAALLQRNLEQRIPGIQIVGTFTPPFRPLTSAEEDELITAIGEAKADIVWVGLSTPKQERFMARMIDRLDIHLMVGVGAAFDIHAGLLADAPAWIKACGLQWLHRLALEPDRLWRRYLANNPRFVWSIGLQLAGLKSFRLTTCNSGSEPSTD